MQLIGNKSLNEENVCGTHCVQNGVQHVYTLSDSVHSYTHRL